MNNITPDSFRILILGSVEIARYLAQLAATAQYAVSVCDPNISRFSWPESIKLYKRVFSESPWPLEPNTHVVIARGHNGDTDSVISLLQQHAEHIYLIASARRAEAIITTVTEQVDQATLLKRLSAPAGLNLGGSSSAEIAMSILAEIQWRHYATQLLPLNQLTTQRSKSSSPHHHIVCPGKRP